ncbi:AI-2E family transporter [Bombella sp. TMW 2.2543]|uniref:AI-2E family transporter n=1 Tax=Bombella pluederhausensis TaxID=2967336 RepID=A0ABT3WEI5_9PROT|nr:AI-2E family transporter [Bombella pluederhausensis]MCX5617481.1 AI-2E family transporter [Bombella pluederhausensis]
MSFFFSRPPVPAAQQTPANALDKIYGIIRLTLCLSLIMLAVWLMGEVLAVLFAATLMAIVLHGLARILRRHMKFIPYPIAVSLVALCVIGLITALVWSNGPAIGEQFIGLKNALVVQSGDVRYHLSQTTIGQMVLDHLPSSLGGNDKTTPLTSFGFGLAGSVTGLLGSAFGLVGTLFVVLIAAFYFAVSPSLYINGFLRLVPPYQREAARSLLYSAGNTLWAWTAGQALDMLAVGIFSGIGLYLIGIPLALALGVVAGLCNFIPYIGAILGAVPALLISLSLGTREALFVAILYSVIQFCEGNILAPLIQRRAVHMPPALAILSQSVFGSILGVPGLVLASPITAALLAMFDKAMPPLADATKTQLETNELTQQEIAKNKQDKAAAAAKKTEESAAPSSDKKQ